MSALLPAADIGKCLAFSRGRPARATLCSQTALAFVSSRDSADERISRKPSQYRPVTPEYLASVTSPPSARAASSSVERCEPMNLTNHGLMMMVFRIGFTSLAACVVGTTPGDHELTVIPLRVSRSFLSSS